MLLSNQSEAVQVATPPQESHYPDDRQLLPSECTDGALLGELHALAVAERRRRKRMFACLLGQGTVTLLVTIATIAYLLVVSAPQTDMDALRRFLTLVLPIGISTLCGVTALRLIQRGARQAEKRLNAILPSLAQQVDVEALPAFAAAVDVADVGQPFWRQNHAAIVSALEPLCAAITPERFEALSRQQVWDVAAMILFPDQRLRDAIAEMAIRCGDDGTLQILDKLLALSRLGGSPWYFMYKSLKREGLTAPKDEESVLQRAIAGLAQRRKDVQRTGQLLRPFVEDPSHASAELVRAGGSNSAASQPEELVRPVPAEPDKRAGDR